MGIGLTSVDPNCYRYKGQIIGMSDVFVHQLSQVLRRSDQISQLRQSLCNSILVIPVSRGVVPWPGGEEGETCSEKDVNFILPEQGLAST